MDNLKENNVSEPVRLGMQTNAESLLFFVFIYYFTNKQTH